LSLLDACGTPSGSRLLRHWLTHPLRSQGAAAPGTPRSPSGKRTRRATGALTQELARASDVERIAARIALASARPRDLAGLRDTLQRAPAIRDALAGIEAPLVVSLANRSIDADGASS
jgi:DNA mismatch repair protein MutS